jgi:hypothetical protein
VLGKVMVFEENEWRMEMNVKSNKILSSGTK